MGRMIRGIRSTLIPRLGKWAGVNMGRQVIPVAEYRQTLHEVNQRYRQAWDRAERLQDELDHIKKSRAYRLLCGWRRLAQRLFRAAAPKPTPEAPFVTEFLGDAATPPNGTVSVIIPFKDRLDLLKTCLHALKRTRYPIREVLLLDNGSTCPRLLRYLGRIGTLPGIASIRASGAF